MYEQSMLAALVDETIQTRRQNGPALAHVPRVEPRQQPS
jgi:hypothetical protein